MHPKIRIKNKDTHFFLFTNIYDFINRLTKQVIHFSIYKYIHLLIDVQSRLFILLPHL